jgi:hypothetical protein
LSRRERRKLACSSLGTFPKAFACFPRRAHFPRHPFIQQIRTAALACFPRVHVAAGHRFQGRFVQQDSVQIRHGLEGRSVQQGSVQQNSVQAGCKSQGRLDGNLGRFLICGCMVFKAICCGMILEICALSTSSLIAVIISEFFFVGRLNKNLILVVFASGFCPGVFTQKILSKVCDWFVSVVHACY